MGRTATKKTLLAQISTFFTNGFQYLFKKNVAEDTTHKYQQNTGRFYSLSPVDNADPDGQYSEALNWALRSNDAKDIRNIALTGPYGSGKSSILKTFERTYADEDLVFLNISLATFREDKDEKPTDTEMLRLIELSILQQILFHEKDENIPDSRFKKTRSLTKRAIRNQVAGVIIFLLCLLYQIKPDLIEEKLRISITGWAETSIHYLTLLFTIIGIALFIRKLIRPLRSIQLKKFNFQDAEFALDDNISKSVLNEHLNEILYFFEVTKYNVVVIEDLDRFEQTEIYTKLRELNFLISNCEKIPRKIAFIYAVRDEIFQDHERTKFFDFIIPVIPVINSSNSNEKLIPIINENNYAIERQLLEDLSMFVDDMRLLYNIMNEFKIYHKKLNPKLDPNKLLAIIFYKNLFPKDFVALSINKGDLYGIFANRDKYVVKDLERLNKEIGDLKNEITELQKIPLKDIEELRKLYVFQYLSRTPKINEFSIEGTSYNFAEVLEEEVFEHFINNNVSYYYSDYYGNRTKGSIDYSFREVEKAVNPQINYKQRLEQLLSLNDGSISLKEEQIAEKERQKQILKHKRIKDHMESELVELAFEDTKQKQLLSILLRSGHIDENYLDYISIFYEGTITKTDKEFLINIKAHIMNDFDYALNKVDILVDKIPPLEYEQSYLFNYDLMDYLLQDGHQTDRLLKVIRTLSNEKRMSTAFIDGYLKRSKDVTTFINILAKEWSGIWKYVSSAGKRAYPDERKEHYFRLLLAHADVADLIKIAEKSDFAERCAKRADFLTLIDDTDKIKQIITVFRIKFEALDMSAATDLVEFVYENKNYEINVTMLESWLRLKGVFHKEEFNYRNYSSLVAQYSDFKKMLDYIDENMEDYFNNVWQLLDDKPKEMPTVIPTILNNPTLSGQSKKDFLQRNQTKVQLLKHIEDQELISEVLSYKKVDATWENVFYYYGLIEQKFDAHLIDFLNDDQVIQELASKSFAVPKDTEEAEVLTSFTTNVVQQEEIELSSYKHLISRISKEYLLDLPYSGLSYDKTEVLIQHQKIAVNPSNFETLYETHPGLQIKLVEGKPSEFMANLDQYAIDAEEYAALLESTKFTFEQKKTILDEIDDQTILESKKLSANIGKFLTAYPVLRDPKVEISKNVMTDILSNKELDINSRIDLMTKQLPMYTKGEFFQIMASWPTPYNEIAINGKKVILPLSAKVFDFANKLFEYKFSGEPKEEKKGIRIYNIRK
ncbi:MAG: AAA family ATPase [Cyclobacteriaceae bacterium]|nr:AAA family ATPase [Cyclobacteriaceae bacterium]